MARPMGRRVREELRNHVRLEPALQPDAIVVRGGIDTLAKLAQHADQVHRAFVLDGESVWGVSAFAMGAGTSAEELMIELWAYRLIHTTTVGTLTAAGLRLLPTFARPHMTV